MWWILLILLIAMIWAAGFEIILRLILPRRAKAWVDAFAVRLVVFVGRAVAVGLVVVSVGAIVWAFTRSPAPAIAEPSAVVQAAPAVAAFPASPWERRHPSNLGK